MNYTKPLANLKTKPLYVAILLGLFFTGCITVQGVNNNAVTVASTPELIDALSKGYDVVNINAKELVISQQVIVNSNTTLNGNGVIIKYDRSKNYNVFVSNGSENVTIKGITISPLEKVFKKNHNGGYYPFKFSNVSNLKFVGMKFKNTINTCLSIYDCHNVEISSCEFEGIGVKGQGNKYSYDGIFIGAYNRGTDNVLIKNCSFKRIGMDSELDFSNDGDGIQTYSKTSTIKNVTIRDCSFNKISRRGIKIQTGRDILIRGNLFEYNKGGIGISMQNQTDNIKILENTFRETSYGIHTNSYKENPCISKGLEIINNKFTNIGGVIRTSGASSIQNAIISNNEITNIGFYFFEGKISNSRISENTIKNYQYRAKKAQPCIALWNDSANNRVDNNSFTQDNNAHIDVYIYANVTNTKLSNNSSVINKKEQKVRIRNNSTSTIIQ